MLGIILQREDAESHFIRILFPREFVSPPLLRPTRESIKHLSRESRTSVIRFADRSRERGAVRVIIPSLYALSLARIISLLYTLQQPEPASQPASLRVGRENSRNAKGKSRVRPGDNARRGHDDLTL